MSILLDCFGLHLSFIRAVATLLSNWMGTGDCLCPNSLSVQILGTSSLPLTNPSPFQLLALKTLLCQEFWDFQYGGIMCRWFVWLVLEE